MNDFILLFSSVYLFPATEGTACNPPGASSSLHAPLITLPLPSSPSTNPAGQYMEPSSDRK